MFLRFFVSIGKTYNPLKIIGIIQKPTMTVYFRHQEKTY